MSHLKLMKLLYLVEREALLRWRRPIFFDCCVSMDKGPVLSRVLNTLHGECETEELWQKTISPPTNYEVRLLEDPGTDSLSDAEEQLIKETFERFGKMSRWEICDYTHDLPEWQDPHGSSIPIEYRDILREAGKTQIEVESILDEINGIALMEMHVGRKSEL
jgi:uncharacterized phage-associated protein